MMMMVRTRGQLMRPARIVNVADDSDHDWQTRQKRLLLDALPPRRFAARSRARPLNGPLTVAPLLLPFESDRAHRFRKACLTGGVPSTHPVMETYDWLTTTR